MAIGERPPAGPRGAIGAAAEDAAAEHLANLGWELLARNLRVERDELDIVALEPGRRPTVVVVEVRSRSQAAFGSAAESVDGAKVARLYRAALALRRGGYGLVELDLLGLPSWRVDLLSLQRTCDGGWAVRQHLRGLAPP